MQVLVYGDCAVNVNPSSKDLASIAACSADTAAAFGLEPRVAMLSYSTMGSGAGPDVSGSAHLCAHTAQCCLEELAAGGTPFAQLSPHAGWG